MTTNRFERRDRWNQLTCRFLTCFAALSGVAFRNDDACRRVAAALSVFAHCWTWLAVGAIVQPRSDSESRNVSESRSKATRTAFDWVQPLGGRVASDTTPNGDVWRVTLDLTPLTDDQLSQLPDNIPIAAISLARTAVSDQGLAHLSPRADLNSLNLFQTKVSDVGLAAIGEIDTLQTLHLQRTNVSDAGMPYLLSLAALRHLELDETSVTDTGMVVLAGLPRLRHLSLRRTQVSDVGLMTLGQSDSIEVIVLTGANVTADGIERFRRLRPGLLVVN